MEFERVKRSHTHIDIAPLVDMVFLLLLFFMLTYHIVADYGIEVSLPEAATAAAQNPGRLEITVRADETIFV
ncbi:MAG TPA: biopolymer transporter ExbD, partial [Acidobacteriota bacterium]|nr:biopolymer transporter ExbD [Acidobacteriota bacterium]